MVVSSIYRNTKVVNAWCMYDWANSVYNLVITTTFFPIYFAGITKAAFGENNVPLLGRTFKNTALYDYTLAFAYFIIALALPVLSSIADSRGNKKLLPIRVETKRNSCNSLRTWAVWPVWDYSGLKVLSQT